MQFAGPGPLFASGETITHPLADAKACAPEGWSAKFARAVHHVVLPGISVFSVDDAKRAGASLLEHGPVRVKPALYKDAGWELPKRELHRDPDMHAYRRRRVIFGARGGGLVAHGSARAGAPPQEAPPRPGS